MTNIRAKTHRIPMCSSFFFIYFSFTCKNTFIYQTITQSMRDVNSHVRAPSSVSLSQLFSLGFISYESFNMDGSIADSDRIHAESQYANFLSNRGSNQTNQRPQSSRLSRPSERIPQRPATSRPHHARFNNLHYDRTHVRPPTAPSNVRRNSSNANPRPSSSSSNPRPSSSSSSIRPSTSSHVFRVKTLKSISDESIPEDVVVQKCCICYTMPRSHAFSPCFHLCVCSTCSSRLSQCPVCRTEISDVHRIYF